ncbi:trichohyalin-like isoform X6 [Mercenaria mercenaria]|uniref:trichohyalin-like isoform X6 n=1 Tax=Mercenaria mercenaria TaxID=6596 RepID=UPI00234F884E|nr:trichohyalin-like isoform X6 [Mercenaria mercenaria]
MRFHNHSTFSDEEVQSGSATGFSDGEREESAKAAQRMNNTFDPVTQILDKIDAELVSLTRSQGSSSTATTGTDNTVIRRPNSRQSLESSRLDNGEGLSLSQLGPNFKPSVSLQSEQDTGIGTSSLQDSTLQHRSLEPEVRPLEPGDSFKDDMRGHHRRSATAPEMMFLNGHHMSDDDKQKRENQNASPFEAKHVDDKFKEILQKRKGGALRNADEDSQTIRTEDFVDRFQDTLVYSSADEAEKLRNIEDDLHSDGGSDTDTLQRKLAILTRTPIHNINNTRDGGTRPLPRPLERTKRKLASSLEIRPRKAAGPGTPPVYPKPTPTTSLPRPSARSSLKLTPGHVSDADSVRTEDFEHKFKDMMVNPGGKKEESDLESVSNDPIHTKVKQLLKATAKSSQRIVTDYKPSDKPKSDYKTKQHVRISPQPVQYQDDDKGDDSDDTLCSDKHTTVSSYRSPESTHALQDESVDETRRQIARESDKIRREMERERRAKSMSPGRDRSPTRTYLTLTQTPKTVYDKGDRPNVNCGAGKSLSDEEKERSAELKATHSALEVTQSALVEARKNLKEVQAQFEDVRTQLMLSEYKKENSSKQLARISNDLQRKQAEVQNLDSQTKTRMEELKQFDAIGFTKDEAVQIIGDNEKMKSRLRNLDAIHAERDELIQQLDSTKQELFTESKKARTQIEELKEEIENVTSTYEQAQTERDEAVKKVQKLETAYRKMEKEKNELIQAVSSGEKTRHYEEEREKYKSEKNELRKRNLDEVETMRQDLIRMTNKVASLQDEVRAKEELHLQLRDQILTLQEKYEHEKTSRNSILDEHKKTLQTLRKETDTAMVQMRESLFLEKQKTVDMMREELDQERRDIAARTEERYDSQITELETIIKAKTDEITHLSKIAAKLETDLTRSKVNRDDEIKMQVQEAVSKERKNLEDDKDWAMQQLKDRLEHEHREKIKHFQEQMTRMKDEQRGLEARMKEQRHELEELKNSNKAVVHEKLVAVARAKELMRQEQLSELDRIKEQLKQEHKKEIDKLKDTIRVQEEELRQFREERMRLARQQKELSFSQDRTERTLVNEINEECRKTSEVLGLTPRQISLSNSQNTTSSKSPTTSALFKILTSPRVGPKEPNEQNQEFKTDRANLRACNEELRMHVTDLQRELEVQRNTLNVADRQKNRKMAEDIVKMDEALSTLKRQLEREKEEEMARLKEKLVRGLSTNEYRSLLYAPDNDATVHRSELKSYPNERHLRQMSEQQHQDLERLEQEISKLVMNTGSGSHGHEDIDYAKRLAQLQSKVRQLQSDNSNLRRAKFNVSSSSPNLTTPDMYNSHRKFTMRSPSPTRDQQRLASNLELRTREHDYETEALTHHQRVNRDIMSKKMAEMSKLQNTLTNQAKELIQLEKAYTQLNQHAKSPRTSVR